LLARGGLLRTQVVNELSELSLGRPWPLNVWGRPRRSAGSAVLYLGRYHTVSATASITGG
jgi:hypothetical protein